MLNYEINVENIKCGGCAGTITKKVSAIDGVSSVDVDIEAGVVKVDGAEGLQETLVSTLLKLGYPESGSAEGMAAAKAKARSFVSCAVGRLNKD